MSPRAAKTQVKALRAAIYDRVSSDRRGDARSVAEQQAANRAATDANGWDVVLAAADNDVSASRFANGKARPGWEQIVAAIEAGKIDVLVLWEPSRGSRELIAWATLIAACRSRGVLIHVTSHHRTYDPKVPRDWRSLAEDGVDSGYESEKASERIRRTMAANALAGRPHGRVPFGYERVYDSTTKALITQRPHPAEAAVVVDIFRRVNAGQPISTIARELSASGVKSAPWSRDAVRRIALNPIYIGKREMGRKSKVKGELLDGDWPPLVDEATFWAVSRRLTDPVRKVTRPGRAKYLLAYLARCGVCDAPMSGVPGGRRPASYRCSAPQSHVTIGMAGVDEVVTGFLLSHLSDPEYRETLTASGANALDEARGEVEKLEAQLEAFYEQADASVPEEERLSAVGLARMERQLLPLIEAAKARELKAAVPSSVAWLLDGDASVDDIDARFHAAPIAARKEVVRTLLTVTVMPASRRGNNRNEDVDRIVAKWRGADDEPGSD